MKLKKLLFLPLMAIVPAVVAPAVLSSCSLADPELYKDVEITKANKEEIIARCERWIPQLKEQTFEAKDFNQAKATVKNSIGNPQGVLYYEMLYLLASRVGLNNENFIKLHDWKTDLFGKDNVNADWGLAEVSNLQTPFCVVETNSVETGGTWQKHSFKGVGVVNIMNSIKQKNNLGLNFTYVENTAWVAQTTCYKFAKILYATTPQNK
ncbi:MAG: hypothetical protein L3I91_00955 [Mycoplasma sp.]